MEIRQGITPENWHWIVDALLMKGASSVGPAPPEVYEVIEAMQLLEDVESACPAIKLTLREKEDA